MPIKLETNRKFRQLLNGEWLNPATTAAFLAEALRETVGPGSITMDHFNRGQGTWSKNAPSTLRQKSDKRIFVDSGRVLRAISKPVVQGRMRDWGSSADIYSRGAWTPKRYSALGIYSQIKVAPTRSSLTVGFNGTYKHSAGFNRIRKELAKAAGIKTGPRGGVSMHDVRRAVSIGEAHDRMRAINADRRARGLKTIKKQAAKGSSGIRGNKHDLARGDENLAYADIVQRGKFIGSVSAKEVAKGGTVDLWFGGKSRGKIHSSKVHAGAKAPSYIPVFGGKKRLLLPYETADESRVVKALDRAMSNTAAELSR